MSSRPGTPFRAALTMGLVLAGPAREHGIGTVAFNTAVRDLDPYEGRGKGKTRFHHAPGNGASISQRAGRKARNVAKHRRACRG